LLRSGFVIFDEDFAVFEFQLVGFVIRNGEPGVETAIFLSEPIASDMKPSISSEKTLLVLLER
jgi:hypothetical protein